MDINPIRKIISEQSAEIESETNQQAKEESPAAGIANAVDVLESSSEVPSQRPDYFSGKLLSEEDFQQEQEYFLNKNSNETPAKNLNTFDPAKDYTSVKTQQGRVQTDSDYNEDQVLVEFQSGDINSAIVAGNLWDSEDTPPASQDSDRSSDTSDDKK